jgi:S-formylglutathione hydrolase FrmB
MTPLPPCAIDWPKLEISNPSYAIEGLHCLTVKSGHLKGRGDITAFLPEGISPQQPAAIPLVILLHGVYGSHWAWALKGGAHRTAQRLIADGEIPPMALAMPSDGLWGDGSGYIPHQNQNFEAWIASDVPAAVERAFPMVSGGPIFLAGLSMGGYGALRLGAKFGRSRFRAVSGLSSATRLSALWEFVTETREQWTGVPPEIAVLDAILQNRQNLPSLRFDCGSEDVLIEENRALHRQLLAAGIAHVYQENGGGHNWEYWERHLPDTLRFFAKFVRPDTKTSSVVP